MPRIPATYPREADGSMCFMDSTRALLWLDRAVDRDLVWFYDTMFGSAGSPTDNPLTQGDTYGF